MNDAPTLGHNNPPQTIADELTQKFPDEIKRYEELMSSAKTAPADIKDDVMHKDMVELAKSMRSLEIVLENNREIEREPWKAKVDAVNGWFKSKLDPLESLRKTIQTRHKDYAERKAAAEKKRLEEEAERKRAQEREALRLAQDAEASKATAAQAAEAARIAADEASLQREAATTDLERAQADYHEARANQARIWAKITEIDADIAQRRKSGEKISNDDVIAMRGDLPKQIAEARDATNAADRKLKESRLAASEARRKVQEAQRIEDETAREVKAADREVRSHFDEAERLDRSASKIEKVVTGPDSDLARVRSEHGAVGTLQRKWVCEVVDFNQLDRDALWPFINGAAIEAALWKWMMAQPLDRRVMKGARIFIDQTGVVR